MTIRDILTWADAHCERTGKWPRRISGHARGPRGKTWQDIDDALIKGGRGLPAGWSLAGLLYDRRGVRGPKNIVPLTERMILRWAEQHRKRTGRWPILSAGEIPGSSGIVWRLVDQALRRGQRGLAGGSSLARLMEKYFGVRSQAKLPKLFRKQILEWADVHHFNTGEWPHNLSGRIIGAPEEKWHNINAALRLGLRGCPGKSSLAQLLELERGHRNPSALPPLSEADVLRWARAFHKRTGKWPNRYSGPVPDASAYEETWFRLDEAFIHGCRGLRGGSSVAKILAKHGVRRHLHAQPRLTHKKILRWARAYQRRNGQWPGVYAGETVGVEGEKWRNINNALMYGLRGLPGGSSLTKLVTEHVCTRK
ncbi:MAG: hypothetical protein IID33_01470 [Planctomycetes bacterium]|nr:hypothetical protein [Planctomycetota bacterium]